MGTDIHMIVQADRGKGWERIAPPELEWHDDFDRKYKQWISDRNYDAFAILADVRNGRGFAGVETGDRLHPIAEPRGIPSGAEKYEDDLGDHSFSWLLLSELVNYPHWDRKRVVHGCVISTEVKESPSLNMPPSGYCGGVSGGKTRVLDEAQWIQYGKPTDRDTYVRFSWEETYAFSASWYYTHLIPALRDWCAKNGVTHDRLRLVFGFDS